MARAGKWFVFAIVSASFARLAWAQAAAAPTLDWQPTHEDAIRVASQSNRWVLVHFYSPNDAACQTLEKDVYSQPTVQQQIHSKFVPCKVNVEQFPLTAKTNGIDRIPADLLLDSAGKPVERMYCPTTADAYLALLESTVAAAKARSAAVANNQASSPATPANQPAMQAAPAVNSTTNQVASTAGGPRYQTPPAVQSVGPLAYNNPTPPPTSTTQAPPQKPAIPAYSEDRYNEFFKRMNSAPPPTSPQKTPVAAPAVAVQPSFGTQPSVQSPNNSLVQAPNPTVPQQSPAATPSWGTAGYFGQPNSNNSATSLYTPPNATAQISPQTAAQPGVAPFGFEGYCPVTMIEQNRWQAGDKRWGAIHRGRTYLFAGPQEQMKFMANPDQFSPAISGRDPVAAIDQGQSIDGQRRFGIRYENRMYLFSSAATLEAFRQNPSRYATQVLQAENPDRGTTVR